MMASDWWSLPVVLAVSVAALAFLWWRRYSRHFARNGVPYVPPLPLVGNFVDMMLAKRAMPNVLNELYGKLNPHPYGGAFSFLKPVLIIRDPDVIRAITVRDFDHFTDHIMLPSNREANPLIQRMLFSLKGKEWHEMRATLSPAFTSKKMKNMFVLMSEIGQQMVGHLTKKTGERGVSSEKENILTLEMKDFFTRVTNDIIATTAFGVQVNSLSEPDNKFFTMGRDMTNVKPFVGLGYLVAPSLMELLGITFLDRKAVSFFKTIVSDTIKTREKQSIVRPDMIHLLMQARRGELTSDEGVRNDSAEVKGKLVISDEDVEAQAMLFLFGGFETVSALMSFCSYELATNEDVQRRLQQEVDKVMESSGGQPSFEQVMNCQYLDMVISETLRMYPPGFFLDRQCVRAYRLPATESCPGVELQPGDGIWVPVHSMHCDPKYFPEPNRFDPERFSPDNKHLIQPFTYYPFGSGPRICIAQRFALMETKIVLLHLLSRFSLQVVAKTPVPLVFDPRKGFSLAIKDGAWLGIRRRS